MEEEFFMSAADLHMLVEATFNQTWPSICGSGIALAKNTKEKDYQKDYQKDFQKDYL